jgi:quinohemoprotein ethanol dehydrogenase
MVFKLGATAQLPGLADDEFVMPSLPALLEVSDDVVAKGANAYANTCVACHGDQAFSSGLVPNLRFSAITANAQAWQTVVREGVLAASGMPNFSEVVDADTAEAIRAYVISEANSGRDDAYYKSFNENLK